MLRKNISERLTFKSAIKFFFLPMLHDISAVFQNSFCVILLIALFTENEYRGQVSTVGSRTERPLR